ncbi:porin [Prevotella sp. oral taxon 313]|uniref:porin n=1 Tax=Prevotella sp. oral taxon 313 TaxID=652722 RepID=UPI000D1F5640|nr:porin [Prevotella sp. oral taxon 313]PTL31264.1 porin [Prevotella sp. oral taxon 313]
MTRKTLLCCCLLALSVSMNAQDNHGYGGDDGHFKSLAEEVTKLKKSNDMFNVYLNTAASAQVETDNEHEWSTGFKNKHLRLEIKGNLTDKLYYRFCYRMTNSNVARSEDNFARSTDVVMIGYRFSDKLSVEAGKIFQPFGGYEVDENPIYIYEYSDLTGGLECYLGGVVVNYKPVPTQEIVVGVTNAHNDKFADVYGDNSLAIEGDGTQNRILEKTRIPLGYSLGWNGSFLNNRLLTRWSWGIEGEARHKYSRMLILGQKLNLDRLQWYFDYMYQNDGLDRFGLASREVRDFFPAVGEEVWMSDVHYTSFITKLNWQFAPQWNLMLKGMYETASVTKVDRFKDFRKSYGYVGSVEYYPVKSQDFRVFLAYVGRKMTYKNGVGLDKYNTNRIELGFKYRIKAY